MKQKPEELKKAHHKLLNNFLGAPASPQDCELWLPQLLQYPALIALQRVNKIVDMAAEKSIVSE